MLICRIKTSGRSEVTKYILSSKKKEFVFDNVTYKIKPDCIYNVTKFGFWSFRCIDYVQGQNDPINYFSEEVYINKNKNLDTISRVIKGVIPAGIKNFELIVILLISAVGFISVMGLYFIYKIAENMGLV